MKIAKEIAESTFGLFAYRSNDSCWLIDDVIDKERVESIIESILSPIVDVFLQIHNDMEYDDYLASFIAKSEEVRKMLSEEEL